MLLRRFAHWLSILIISDVRFPDCGVSCVMGIGYDAWIQLHLPVPLPKELENFVPVVGEKHIAVSSKGDLHFHIISSNSHIALANVGDEFKIIRVNMPFGNMSTNEMGTYFIAYASTFSTVKKMLNNMFIGSPKGNYDRLLDFSIPKTGTSIPHSYAQILFKS